MKVRVDFHVHTVYSSDSVMDYRMLVDSCRERKIDAVAIMDHDEIRGALEYRKLSREARSRGEWAPRILVGEEVRTTHGEICGLFIEEWIQDQRHPRETMETIRGQGGLVYIPHPFDLLKMKRLKAKELVELEDLIDIIEVFNGKPRFPGANWMARRFLEHGKFPAAAGSDAHDPNHLGAAYVEMEDFEGPGDLIDKLWGAEVFGKMYSPLTSAFMRYMIRRGTRRRAKSSAP